MKDYVRWLVRCKAEYKTSHFVSPYNQIILDRDCKDKADYIEILFKGGYDVNVKSQGNYTPSHFAVEQNDLVSLRKLLEFSPKLDISNSDGFTPLQLAEKLRRREFVELLRSHSS